ncbi:type IV pilus assembly protein PilM [bacterium]|nr:type IV pilus assembly protein PilM [bacterium]
MPQYKQCLGVDLGLNTVKIVELAVDKNSVRVVRAASAPTGVNTTMSPDEIRQATILAAKELIKKSRFGTKKAVFSISGQKVFIRRFRLPMTSEERLARIIQYEARQQIPFPLDKTYLQYQYRVLPDEGEVEVLLVAVRHDEIRDFMGMLGKIGLTPIGVGVSSFALYSGHYFMGLNAEEREAAFATLHPRRRKDKKAKGKKTADAAPAPEAAEGETPVEEFAFEEVKAFVNLGAGSYDLAIGRVIHGASGGGTISFSRTVPMGGDEMTRAIMRNCGVESFHDAERIKTSACQLMSFNFDFEQENQINEEASTAVTEIADRIVTEIRRSVDFFMAQPDGMAIDSLVLSGGQAQLPGFDSYLEEKLSVPVVVANQVPEDSPLQWPESAGPTTPYVVAIGLGLQGLNLSQIKVDFLPEDRKIIRDFPYKVTAVMLVMILITAGIASQAGEVYAEKYTREAENIQKDVDKRRGDVENFDQAQQFHVDTAKDFENLSKMYGQRSYWIDFLGGLAKIKPPEVLITDVQMDHDGAVVIEGFSQVQVSAAYFRDALNKAFEGRLKAVKRVTETPAGLAPGAPGIPTPTPGVPREEAIIDDIQDVRNPPPPFNPPASRFRILLQLKDKQNHLNITPTPTPTPVGGGPAQQGGRGSGLLF